jgi:hypothetical protein
MKQTIPAPPDTALGSGLSLTEIAWLLAYIRPEEVAELRGTSVETFKAWARENGIKLEQLGLRAVGCRRHEALGLPSPLVR